MRINFVAVSIRRLLLLRQKFSKISNYWTKFTKETEPGVSFWRAAYYSNRKWYCLSNSTYRWTRVYLFSSFLISLYALYVVAVMTFAHSLQKLMICIHVLFVLFSLLTHHQAAQFRGLGELSSILSSFFASNTVRCESHLLSWLQIRAFWSKIDTCFLRELNRTLHFDPGSTGLLKTLLIKLNPLKRYSIWLLYYS